MMMTPTSPAVVSGAVKAPSPPPPAVPQPSRTLHRVSSFPQRAATCTSNGSDLSAPTQISTHHPSRRVAAASASLARNHPPRDAKRLLSAKEQTSRPDQQQESSTSSSNVPKITGAPLPRPSSLRRHHHALLPLSRYPGVCVDLSNCRYDIVRHVFQNILGFSVVSFDTVSTSTGVTDVLPGCQLYWSDRTLAPMRVHKLAASRCIANHFPGIEVLCRKVSIGKLLSKLQTQFPEAYDFFPQTFVSYDDFTFAQSRQQLQQQQVRLHEEIEEGRAKQANYYICKPNGGCCGRGIVITDRVTPWMFDGVVRAAKVDGELYAIPNGSHRQDIGSMDPCVVQQYISRPLLVQGRKCDLRCYVLITSIDPLEVFFHNEGIVRLCASQYEAPCDSNIRDPSIHLANYSVNKSVSITGNASNASSGNYSSSNAMGDSTVEGHFDAHHREEEEDQTPLLKWSFSRYKNYILHQIQRSPALLANAEALYNADQRQQRSARVPSATGSTTSSTPHVILAAFMVERLWSEIYSVVLKSVVAAYPSMKKQLPVSNSRVSSRSHQIHSASSSGTVPPPPSGAAGSSSCSGSQRRTSTRAGECSVSVAQASPFFELLGFDILVDEDLKPWLIEINHSPSWATDTVFDFELKRRVLRDALERTVVRRFAHHRQQSTVSSHEGHPSNSPRHSDALSQRWANGRSSIQQLNSSGKPSNSPLPLDALRHHHGASAPTLSPSWERFDEEYSVEGNGFHRIFPLTSPSSAVGRRASQHNSADSHASPELQTILKHQGVVTGIVEA